MSSAIRIGTLALALVLVLVSGCAKVPQQEIDGAKAALDAAKTAEADRYATSEFNAANDSLQAALALVETQNSRLSVLRNYDHATVRLNAVTAAANTVRDEAINRKEGVRQEVQTLLADIRMALVDAQRLIAAAPTGKEGRVVLNTMKGELATLETSLTQVTDLMTSGDYLTAREKAEVFKSKVLSIEDELRTAIARHSALKRKAS